MKKMSKRGQEYLRKFREDEDRLKEAWGKSSGGLTYLEWLEDRVLRWVDKSVWERGVMTNPTPYKNKVTQGEGVREKVYKLVTTLEGKQVFSNGRGKYDSSPSIFHTATWNPVRRSESVCGEKARVRIQQKSTAWIHQDTQWVEDGTMDKAKRISWLDSCGMPSSIHLTVDGVDTLCGNHSEYIAHRILTRVPRKERGGSRYCRRCFANGGKALPWDSRCIETTSV